MKNQITNPVVLTILDGWGLGEQNHTNAIHLAKTPVMDKLQELYPFTQLSASGLDVGLPFHQVGNSEVGHTSIGGGRIILQDLVKITKSIEDKSFYDNSNLNKLCKKIEEHQSQIHVIGLCSDGGVHSHIEHLLALMDLINNYKIDKLCIHFIADGRDTEAKCAAKFINLIQNKIKNIGIGKICSISGRYYAMDRDCRWARTEAFYKILTENQYIDHQAPVQLIQSFYNQDISDEFIIPTRIDTGSIQDNDGIILFNFRPDRMRQLCQVFCKESFKGFKTKTINNLSICSFTQYDSTLQLPVAFEPTSKINFLGEIIAKNQLKQLRIAETEKYAHVTYFLNGGIEEPFNGEDRELISSPQVATYDESPHMSASQITQSVVNALSKNIYNLIVINYANPDMVGHTGNLSRTIEAIECIDREIDKIFKAVHKVNGTLIITADHGNAEYMLDANQQVYKAHTNNLVPFILVDKQLRKKQDNQCIMTLKNHGSLTDIAPTILDLLNLKKPKEMTGTSLITPSEKENKTTIKL
uniref:2,3-bisphosphoglycerate-independent phosphoglycerate mutase n=1 Tax=Neoizziella asiatica TaxID=1077397 RepID=A0A1G4NWX8_9FLOR|nr:Phosphoglycerate mutase [Neoizziella asiatica]SCW23134.1 Phosphoglycerate mutase [Neoizziella asiatica]